MYRQFRITCSVLLMLGCGSVRVDAQVEAGAELYGEKCADCHGARLNSTGSAPDLREMGVADKPRFDKTVIEGRNQMPSWDGVLSAEEMDQIWAYIRSRATN